MNRLIPLAVVMALAFAANHAAQARATDAPKYSETEIRQMIRDAHTAQQYETLATYFRSRQQELEQQAETEKQEWDRRSQITTGIYQKYPRPADSSRNRYEYFKYEAQQMSQQAAHFESLLTNAKP